MYVYESEFDTNKNWSNRTPVHPKLPVQPHHQQYNMHITSKLCIPQVHSQLRILRVMLAMYILVFGLFPSSCKHIYLYVCMHNTQP